MGEVRIVSTPYDDVFRTLLNDCRELIIPVINEMFDENYSGEEKIVFAQDVHFLNQQDGNEEKEITDSSFRIERKEAKKYHLECQSNIDNSMLVRFFEYDTQIALDGGEIEKNVLTLTFPHSAVLYLRHHASTPDKLRIRMVTPGGSIEYDIAVMKVQKYTLQDIFEKDLLFLLPFYIFSHEKRFEEYEQDEKKLEMLLGEYGQIKDKLEELLTKGRLSEYVKCTLIDMTNKVVWHIAEKYDSVREGVKSVMGGKVLEYEAKAILNEGMEKGMEKGMEQGRILTVRIFREAQRNPGYTPEQIAKEVGCTEQEAGDTLKMFGMWRAGRRSD